MPNHKSAEKRVRITEKQNARNRMIRTGVRNAVRAVRAAKKTEEGRDPLKKACVLIDKACQKGIYHRNTAARKKSRLSHFVEKLG